MIFKLSLTSTASRENYVASKSWSRVRILTEISQNGWLNSQIAQFKIYGDDRNVSQIK